MSFLVKRVDIQGFQHNRDIAVTLHNDVNFIIGRNGSGKTTFIRILYAAISLDISELSPLPFKRVTVTFFDENRKKSPSLKIERDKDRDSLLTVYFRNGGSEAYVQYLSDDDQSSAELLKLTSLILRSSRNQAQDKKLPSLSSLRQKLKADVHFSWLPLMRSRSALRRNDFYTPEYSEEPINRKLRELLAATSNYLSALDSEVADATRAFQRDVFVSYLEKNTFDPNYLNQIDLKDEQRQLTSMFVEMGYSVNDIQSKINSYFDRARKTKERLSTKPAGYLTDDLVSLISSSALHRIVNAYQNFIHAKQEITQPKSNFIQIINEMIYRKKISFSNSNQLVVEELANNSEDNLDVYELSSGEKQLLVILIEALLQQQREYIFLADEPELSLHVDWQEKLVGIIRRMNSKAQVIFATHSPDIVSIYQGNIFDFEKI